MVTPQPQDGVVKKAIEQLKHVVDELIDTGSGLDVVVRKPGLNLQSCASQQMWKMPEEHTAGLCQT